MSVHTGVVEKGGAWYSYKDFKWQGGDNVLAEWKNNPLLFDEITSKTHDAILKQNETVKTVKESVDDVDITEDQINENDDNIEVIEEA